MKSKTNGRLRAEAAARATELIDDLNAVRSVVMNKQRNLGPQEAASLERRLFESWVIEHIAQTECLLSRLNEDVEQIQITLKETTKQLAKVMKKLEK